MNIHQTTLAFHIRLCPFIRPEQEGVCGLLVCRRPWLTITSASLVRHREPASQRENPTTAAPSDAEKLWDLNESENDWIAWSRLQYPPRGRAPHTWNHKEPRELDHDYLSSKPHVVQCSAKRHQVTSPVSTFRINSFLRWNVVISLNILDCTLSCWGSWYCTWK